ncbi:MAG TPA: Ni/Fe-hydrogenase cytochrome b subunit [Thermoanaerobaculia bacterium]|jgi:Ni/Fe-hydrogenase subunit HybB-like protein|nr:Ni/Fe-hydrogenase cytochrome b subunit [Thermoanaerobaculia bacterium]
MTLPKIKITFWRVLGVIFVTAGLYSTFIRFYKGLGASTNLSDSFPWGLWIGFDCLCGIMLAAGGFTLMATVYVFNLDKFKGIARAALVTAFLGYLLEICAVLFDLGRPYRIWHPLIMWNPRSVMFLVGWCVMLYTTILALEFAPVVFQFLRLEKPLRILRAISTPIIIVGVVVSIIHQSALGSFYLIVPGKLHPLWYSPLLPLLFFVSAVAVGLGMTIFESTMSARHFNHALEKPVILALGRVMMVVLIAYGILRFEDLIQRGALKYALAGGYEANMFWVEVTLGVLLPVLLLSFRAIRENPIRLYIVSMFVVGGFMVNRLNVAVTGMEHAAGHRYVPKWSEVSVTLMMVTIGIFLFTMVMKYLPIFHAEGPAKEKAATLPAGVSPVPAR